jgi:hypothetical protein
MLVVIVVYAIALHRGETETNARTLMFATPCDWKSHAFPYGRYKCPTRPNALSEF